ncbi:MAG: ATP-binding cassette domain-containing protein [Planctomycetes bacterium]|nr:ATP-binding cassette domain-containing protein [Planctomycetota bacterium]
MTAGPLLGGSALVCGPRRAVLAGVALAVHPGDSWFVLGGNGAGKTTLVQTLIGLQPPLGGTLLPPCGGDRSALGYVPQEPRSELPLPLAVGEWVASVLPDAMPPGEATARATESLAALGMAAHLDSDLRRLSLGQRRRVHIARALVRRPRLLVLDEPGANLDAHALAQLCADLDALRRARGTALVHVAHDLAVAKRFASHVALVGDGVVAAGRVEDFARELAEWP